MSPTETPFSDLLPSGWHLTHLILLDPEWQANICDGEHVAIGTGEDHITAIHEASNRAVAHLYAGKLFHFPRATVELSPTIPLLSALGLIERPIHRRKV